MPYIIKIHNILANYLFHIKTEKVLKKQYILRQKLFIEKPATTMLYKKSNFNIQKHKVYFGKLMF